MTQVFVIETQLIYKKFNEDPLYVIEACESRQTKVNMTYQTTLVMFKKKYCLRRFFEYFMNFCIMTIF